VSDIIDKLNDSIAIVAENRRLRELVSRQRSEIALMHYRLRVTELKLHRRYEAECGLPSLLREQA
jgi:hypothetical protein